MNNIINYFAVIVPRIQGLLLTAGGQFLETDEIHDFLMWDVGQWVKNRGIRIDVVSARAALALIDTEKLRLDAEMVEITGGVVTACSHAAAPGAI